MAECFQLYISCFNRTSFGWKHPYNPQVSMFWQILHHEQYPGESSYIMFLLTIGLDPSYSSCIYTRMQFVSYQAKQYDATHIWPTLVLDSPNKYPVSNSWLRSETYGSQTQMVSHVNGLPWSIDHLMLGSGLQEHINTMFAGNAVRHYVDWQCHLQSSSWPHVDICCIEH